MHTSHHIPMMSLAVRTRVPVRGRRSSEQVAELVSCAARGERRAWDALVDEFGAMVWTIARSHRLSDADAADVAQSTWLRLLERLGELKDPARVGAWLATTARRECFRVLRTARRQVPAGEELFEDEAPETTAAEALLCAERDRALWRCFGRLRATDQALLRLLVADPRPAYEEIAAMLDMPIGSIGPTRARALERLRKELQREGELALMTC
jgi:RNA polymerase sigma factor (sigma-70 family)